MRFTTERVSEDKRAVRGWITPERLILYCLPSLAFYGTVLVLWAKASNGFTLANISHPGNDLAVFWTASHMVLHDHAWRVYDFNAFSSLESTLFSFIGRYEFLPWLYPPTFLVAVAPLALVSFPVALAIWSVLGIGAYAWSIRKVVGFDGFFRARSSFFVAIASPFAVVPLMFGQNSLLTASLAALSIYWLKPRPVMAGICIGMLAIKPQLAMLFPLALLIAGAWRAIASAAITTLVFVAASIVICSWKSVELFRQSTLLSGFILEDSPIFWHASPTPFAAFRLAGIPIPLAFAAHLSIAALAIFVMCRVWRATQDVAHRTAAFAITTLLTNPYLWHYELAWLGLAAFSLVTIGWRSGWRRGEQELLVLTWVLPIYEVFNRVTFGPQVGPLIVSVFLLILVRRGMGSSGYAEAAD
jgi:alpha-1,2-mannosyltransferase